MVDLNSFIHHVPLFYTATVMLNISSSGLQEKKDNQSEPELKYHPEGTFTQSFAIISNDAVLKFNTPYQDVRDQVFVIEP